jgi:hypothetical protein
MVISCGIAYGMNHFYGYQSYRTLSFANKAFCHMTSPCHLTRRSPLVTQAERP